MAGVTIAAILCGGLPASAGQPDWTKTGFSARTNYVLRCSGCHGLDGAGSEKGGIPALRDSIGAFAGDDEGRTYVVKVPGVRNANLTPAQTAAVLNYVMKTFAGSSLPPDAEPFDEAEVASRQSRPVTDVVALRRDVAARLKERGITVADYPWP
ncbi:c-type cytochrome [Chthonobacter albigriseus]|uniref:c-type cytochrome n=1 Tax=Chthonobacter albigriseus TaxID=1683161 RepID=UPI0015EE7288|nr:cytochrome c [Chthonobacter albigriseus]